MIESRNLGFRLEQVKEIELVDPAIADRINDPVLVRELIGVPLQYSATIETEVGSSGAVAEALLPDMDDQLSEFFAFWYPQEASHGEGQSRLLSNIGLEAIPTHTEKVSFMHRALGKATILSSNVRDILESFVMGYMAVGERETIEAYTEYSRLLMRHGEVDISRMFGAYAIHERKHLNFQKDRAAETRSGLTGLSGRLPGLLLVRTYLSVGVDELGSDRAAHFAYLLENITSDNGANLAQEITLLVSEMFPNISEDNQFAQKLYSRLIKDVKSCS